MPVLPQSLQSRTPKLTEIPIPSGALPPLLSSCESNTTLTKASLTTYIKKPHSSAPLHPLSLSFCHLYFLVYPLLPKGFRDSSVGKESACNTRDPGSIPGLGRSAGEGIGYPLHHSARISGLFCSLVHLQHQLKISTQGLPWWSSI